MRTPQISRTGYLLSLFVATLVLFLAVAAKWGGASAFCYIILPLLTIDVALALTYHTRLSLFWKNQQRLQFQDVLESVKETQEAIVENRRTETARQRKIQEDMISASVFLLQPAIPALEIQAERLRNLSVDDPTNATLARESEFARKHLATVRTLVASIDEVKECLPEVEAPAWRWPAEDAPPEETDELPNEEPTMSQRP